MKSQHRLVNNGFEPGMDIRDKATREAVERLVKKLLEK